MEMTGKGYEFTCKQDVNRSYGVACSFSVVSSEAKRFVHLTCCIDSLGKVVLPAVMNASIGFTPITKSYKTEEELNTFIRSNKPFYGKVGGFIMIGHGAVVLDLSTGEWIEQHKFSFYMPKTVDDSRGIMVCDRVSKTKGINEFTVPEKVLDAYKASFIQDITLDTTESKLEFLKYLVGRENA